MQMNFVTGNELTMNKMMEKMLKSEDEWNILNKFIIEAGEFRGREKKAVDDITMDRINISIVVESFFVCQRYEL